MCVISKQIYLSIFSKGKGDMWQKHEHLRPSIKYKETLNHPSPVNFISFLTKSFFSHSVTYLLTL